MLPLYPLEPPLGVQSLSNSATVRNISIRDISSLCSSRRGWDSAAISGLLSYILWITITVLQVTHNTVVSCHGTLTIWSDEPFLCWLCRTSV